MWGMKETGNRQWRVLGLILMCRFVVPGGDLREAKPFLQVNTGKLLDTLFIADASDYRGLRRLGCGGRAAMTLETPK
jgi:hypothetical protein